ncbi:MAG: dihydroxy-acid dehydratase [Chloroflexota bacterium]|nr:dihydroxy-acid dehydratase [Chloroflexota bacterium]
MSLFYGPPPQGSPPSEPGPTDGDAGSGPADATSVTAAAGTPAAPETPPETPGPTSPDTAGRPSRSATFFGQRGTPAGFTARAFTKAMGFTQEDLAKPVIGIAQTWSEFNNCNAHFRQIAEAVKRGVWQEGGLPLEFPTISLGEVHTQPTSMLFRNLMAMDTEEMIRAQPMDAVVLLAACDKTTPAALMGAASANVPAIMVSGGPMLNGRYNGQELGACTDCGRYTAELRAGTITPDEYSAIEDAICRSAGSCMVMGTASTMASMAEALGMALPGNAAIPAPDSRRQQLAEMSGRQAVRLARWALRPSDIMTPAAFENAIRVCMAIGGSTNAVVHLIAIAGRLGIDLPLSLFDRLSRETPWIVNLKPSGRFQMEELFDAGGIPAVMKELAPLLHPEPRTVTGRSVGENLTHFRATRDRDVIAPLDQPLGAEGGTVVLSGNLCPDGAVLKQTAADADLMVHRGHAVVFTSIDDLRERIDDPDLDVTPDSVLVLQHAGPVGAPGMPEVGFMPIPKKLLAQGVRDMVRISDARMSGTSYGTIVLHVAPESAIGGPLALVRNGDCISLDVPQRRLTLEIPEAELTQRRAAWRPPTPQFERGYRLLYQRHVLQAPQGCDFDFLRLPTGKPIGS